MHVETPARMQDNVKYNRFVHKGQLSKALSLEPRIDSKNHCALLQLYA